MDGEAGTVDLAPRPGPASYRVANDRLLLLQVPYMPLSANPRPEDCVLLMIDIQPGILENSHTNPEKKVRLATKTAVKVANTMGIPVFVSLIPVSVKAPEAVDELVGLPTYTRHFAGAFNQPEIREAIGATGRKVLAIGGIVSEVAVLHGARTAMREGYSVYILVDCCGGLSERTEQATFQELRDAGATLSCVPSFFTTLVNDLTSPVGAEMLKALHGLMAKE